MHISIDRIKPSPNPVRKTWDEDKMNELAQSIKEQGLIVPIKVRPVMNGAWLEPASGEGVQSTQKALMDDDFLGDTFEIVYGHRRVEAANRAGLDSVEAIVEGVDDKSVLVQALIENIQREDMTPLDKARALSSLKHDFGISYKEMATQGIISVVQSWKIRGLLNEPDEIQELMRPNLSRLKPLNTDTVARIRETDIDFEEGSQVLKKVYKEQLNREQGAKIAKAVSAAPTPQAKKKLLEWEYSPTIHDPELIKERAKTHGANDPIYRNNKPSPADEFEDSPEIKMLIDGLTMAFNALAALFDQVSSVAEIGKLAPEGKQFLAHKIKLFRNKVDKILAELED